MVSNTHWATLVSRLPRTSEFFVPWLGPSYSFSYVPVRSVPMLEPHRRPRSQLSSVQIGCSSGHPVSVVSSAVLPEGSTTSVPPFMTSRWSSRPEFRAYSITANRNWPSVTSRSWYSRWMKSSPEVRSDHSASKPMLKSGMQMSMPRMSTITRCVVSSVSVLPTLLGSSGARSSMPFSLRACCILRSFTRRTSRTRRTTRTMRPALVAARDDLAAASASPPPPSPPAPASSMPIIGCQIQPTSGMRLIVARKSR